MSEAKHTPGPWEWSEDSPDAVLRGGDRDVVLRPNYGICVGDIYGIIMAKKEDKDLIAAAPDMLDALEKAKQFIQNGIQYGYINMPDKDCGDSALETPAKIEAAIQKARGGGEMNEERRYLAMHGLTYEVSVEGDGDCKKAYFNKPINSYEEGWWALGVKEDAEAIANLAVNLRDELRSCIVERDRARAINNELLEALEFCCVIAKPGNPPCCCPVYHTGKDGGCSENEDGECHIWKAIQKARGENEQRISERR